MPARNFAKYLDGVDVVPVYGGAPIREQIDRLARGGQVVVGTPGRVLDLLTRGKLILADARMVVLDEADEMLSMGFIDDVRAILRRAPWGRQTALFSATMPPEIRKLAAEELHSPETVSVTPEDITVERIEQRMLEVEPRGKLDAIDRVLRDRDAALRDHLRPHEDRLPAARRRPRRRRGHRVRALHGDMSQGARDSVMIAFRGDRVRILVATDVASRGLDVSQVSARHQLRPARRARGVRAPHRPHRPCRPRRQGDLAGHHAASSRSSTRSGAARAARSRCGRHRRATRRGRADGRRPSRPTADRS